jgi:hypothetical protein
VSTTTKFPELPAETRRILVNFWCSSRKTTVSRVWASALSRTDLARFSVEIRAKMDALIAKPGSPVMSPSPTAVNSVWKGKTVEITKEQIT